MASGRNCSEGQWAFAIWDMLVLAMRGEQVHIPFYVTSGGGILLLDNDILAKYDHLGTGDILVVLPSVPRLGLPPGYPPVGDLGQEEMVFETYKEVQAWSLPTYLLVVPTKKVAFKSYFSSFTTLRAPQVGNKFLNKRSLYDGEVAKCLALKLHSYGHLTSDHMKRICSKANVLTVCPSTRQQDAK